MKPGTDYIGVGVGAFILNDKGEVLLMRRGPASKNEVGTWNLPGGQVDFGETLQDAIRREVMEELTVTIELDGQLPAVNHIIKEEGQHWVTTTFRSHIVSGTPEIAEPEKCDRLEWFSLKDLPSPLASTAQGFFNGLLNN